MGDLRRAKRGVDPLIKIVLRKLDPVRVHHQALTDCDQRQPQLNRLRRLLGLPDLAGGDDGYASTYALKDPFSGDPISDASS